MKANLGDVIKISVRKRNIYKVVNVRKDGTLEIRKVNKADFTDAGDKTTFVIQPKQFDMIEEILGNAPVENKGTKKESLKLSEMLKNAPVYMMKRDWQAVQVLENLASQYSPENLTCDGELSNSEIRARKAELDRKWQAMETYFQKTIVNDIC